MRDNAIPAGNPFAAGGGAPEVWALGLRNPFRASFNSANGDLFIGDVGEASSDDEAGTITDDVGANPASVASALARIDALVGAAAQSAGVVKDLFQQLWALDSRAARPNANRAAGTTLPLMARCQPPLTPGGAGLRRK